MKALDLSGRRFGMLTALERTTKAGSPGLWWRCLCDCGAEALVLATILNRGRTRSCGCLKSLSTKKRHEARRAAIKICGTCGRAKTQRPNGNWTCLPCRAAQSRAQYANNQEERRARGREAQRLRRASEPDHVRELKKAWNKRDRQRNPERAREKSREYRKRNPLRYREETKRAQLRAREALAEWYVKATLAKHSTLRASDMPTELISLKREQLRLRRLAREMKQAATKPKDQP